jgi:phage major head subunit gpT-like protein
MPQDSAGFAVLTDLDPVLSEIFFQQYRQMTPMLLSKIIGVRGSNKAKETHQRIGSFGDPQPWEGQVHYDSADPDYQIEWSHEQLTLGFKVEKTLLEDMQYSGIFDKAANLGQSFNRKVVKDEASVFNNAFTTTGYDGKALVATDHPRSKVDSTAVSNSMGTVALTDANLEAATLKLEGLGDDRGEEVTTMATHLVVGRSLRQTALKLTGSQLEPETGNNAVNTHTSLVPVVHPLITSKKWFVVDAGMALRQMIWYWRLFAEFDVDDDKSSTLMRSYFGRMRYSFGWQDFRWIVGSNAS